MKAIRCLRTTILTRLILAGIGLLALGLPADSQAPPASIAETAESIQLHSAVRREMRAGENHRFKVAVEKGMFANLLLLQERIETVVAITDPAGKPVMEFEATKARGVEQPIGIVSDNGGEYIISIRHRTKEAPLGQYEIKWTTLRPATEADRASVESMTFFLEARSLNTGGKYNDALVIAEKSLEAAGRAGAMSDERTAEILNLIGDIYSNKGEYKQTEAYLKRSLAAYEKLHGSESYFVAVLLNNLAYNYRVMGEFDLAEQMYLRALAIDENYFGGEHTEIAQLLNNLGFLYYTKGDYSRVEPFYNRSLAMWTKFTGPESMNVATVTNNLALLYRARGDYPRTIEALRKSFGIGQKNLAEGHPSIATMANNLGAVSNEVGDFEEAERYFNMSLSIREKRLGPDHPDLSNVLNNLGTMFEQRGDREKAEAYYKRALAIREKAYAADNPQIAVTLGNLGLFYSNGSEYAKAQPLLERALEINEKKLGKDHQSVANQLANLGLLHTSTGRFDTAEPLLLRSLQVYEASVGPNHPLTARPLSTLASMYAAKGELGRALSYQERYLANRDHNLDLNLYIGSERQKLAYVDTLSRDIDTTLSLNSQFLARDAKAKEMALGLILNRKGRTLDAIAAGNVAIRQRLNAADKQLLDRLSDVRTQLATLTLRGLAGDKPDAYKAKLRSLEETREKLEDEVSRRSGNILTGERSLGSGAIRNLIPQDAVLIEFVSYKPSDLKRTVSDPKAAALPARYAVYIARRTGEIEWADLGDVAAIDMAAAKLRAAMRDPSRRDTRRLARELDQKLMEPVRAMIGDATHLLISPDGELNLLAFEALADRQNRYLAERYLVTYLTSGRDLARLESGPDSKGPPTIFANPAFGTPSDSLVASSNPAGRSRQRRSITVTRELNGTYFAPLRGTALEAEAIRKLIPEAKVRASAEASESAIKSVQAPRILHIATHGFFIGDPQPAGPNADRASTSVSPSPLLRSGLALVGANNRQAGEEEDGLLTGLEASGLDLHGTKLVVLSACDTGVGEVRVGEGVFGLRRAFTLAGAESLVMSLWPVSDQVTRELMVSYYKNVSQGLGRGEALRRAKLDMIRRPNRSHPFYWASFIQSGEWTPLDGKR